MLDYIYYILAVLVIGLLCFRLIHVNRPENSKQFFGQNLNRLKREKATLQAVKKSSPKKISSTKIAWKKHNSSLRKAGNLQQVRTPWGWPQSQALAEKVSRPSLSAAMQSFTDRLVKEKKVLRSEDTRSRECIRALLEDRYGRAGYSATKEIQYRKVKPPLLRDPSAPPDQMDHFGGFEVDRVREKVARIQAMTSDPNHAGANSQMRYVEVQDIKLPWGW